MLADEMVWSSDGGLSGMLALSDGVMKRSAHETLYRFMEGLQVSRSGHPIDHRRQWQHDDWPQPNCSQ